MTQFYCFTCDRHRDSNTEDMADYSGDDPICGDCVQEAEEQKNQWWQSLDADAAWIEQNL